MNEPSQCFQGIIRATPRRKLCSKNKIKKRRNEDHAKAIQKKSTSQRRAQSHEAIKFRPLRRHARYILVHINPWNETKAQHQARKQIKWRHHSDMHHQLKSPHEPLKKSFDSGVLAISCLKIDPLFHTLLIG